MPFVANVERVEGDKVRQRAAPIRNLVRLAGTLGLDLSEDGIETLNGSTQGDLRMAKIAPDIEESIKKFLAALRLHKQVDMAYLYGSQAKGRVTEWSDIDIAHK